jgi:hypothetical protein
VDGFPWLAGTDVGPVPSYGVVDLNGSYRLTRHITAGADAANLLDNDHQEAFGGDLLDRRMLGHVTYSCNVSGLVAFACSPRTPAAPRPCRVTDRPMITATGVIFIARWKKNRTNRKPPHDRTSGRACSGEEPH